MPPLIRPIFFEGRVLTAADFQLEQRYTIERARLHNRVAHGNGVASGLAISVSPITANQATVHVAPGSAIDGLGNELELTAETKLAMPQNGFQFYIVIRYLEIEMTPMLVTRAGASDSYGHKTAVEESVQVLVVPTPDPLTNVVLAKVIKPTNAWIKDPAFKPKKLG